MVTYDRCLVVWNGFQLSWVKLTYNHWRLVLLTPLIFVSLCKSIWYCLPTDFVWIWVCCWAFSYLYVCSASLHSKFVLKGEEMWTKNKISATKNHKWTKKRNIQETQTSINILNASGGLQDTSGEGHRMPSKISINFQFHVTVALLNPWKQKMSVFCISLLKTPRWLNQDNDAVYHRNTGTYIGRLNFSQSAKLCILGLFFLSVLGWKFQETLI